jgi:hypothetical protein
MGQLVKIKIGVIGIHCSETGFIGPEMIFYLPQKGEFLIPD